MRSLCLGLAALLLSGCTSTGGAANDAAAPDVVTPPRLVVADGTYSYHDLEATASINAALNNALEAYHVASQVVVNPCEYEGDAYFSNSQVPTYGRDQPARSGNLTVTVAWTDADYPRPTIVLGYQAPGMDGLAESARLGRGEEATLPIQAGTGGNTAWRLFICLNHGSTTPVVDPDWQPGLFVGSFTIHAAFQGDPEPAPPAANETRRSS